MLSETLLLKLEVLWGIPIFYTMEPYEVIRGTGLYVKEESPLIAYPELRADLIRQQDTQLLPVLYRYQEKFMFFCIRSNDMYYLSGPFTVEQVSFMEIHRFYRSCHLYVEEEKPPRRVSGLEVMNFVSLLYELLTGKHITAAELTEANHLIDNISSIDASSHTDLTDLEIDRIDTDVYHHTYREEQQTLDYVQDGRVKEVRERAARLMSHAGTLSEDPIRSQRYLAVSGVTLATRAAIKGGVAPADAYQMSDYLIRKIDKMARYDEITEALIQTMVNFTQMVAAQNDGGGTSYTSRAKHYISWNYHHKIYIQDIADTIGISQGHLSRVFHTDTGMSIQDYIMQYRVKRAAELLLHSDLSLSEISSYVCFQSQSHFGNTFKKYMGMTPGEYRKKNGGPPEPPVISEA